MYEPKSECNLDKHMDNFITSGELEEALTITKNGKRPGEDKIK